MQLRTFADKAPATTINAADLDANFRKLRPIATGGEPRHYYINETPDGWSIRVLPQFPGGPGPFLLGFAGGKLYWTGSGVDEPDSGNGFIEEAPEDGSTYARKDAAWSAINVVPPPPASGTHVLGSQNGVITWLATEACA
jgi:hypothetical protein